MAKNIEPALLRNLLRYEPETGKLVWLARPVEMFENCMQSAESRAKAWNTRWANVEAFVSPSQGYRYGRIFRQIYPSHRVIWAMQAGFWPDVDIDHINGNRSDNRWSNLRCANRSENLRNKGLCGRNKSGVKGVSWDAKWEKWRATINVNRRQTNLGRFVELADAAAAYRASIAMHGEFGRFTS
jgi:hypothetical protein